LLLLNTNNCTNIAFFPETKSLVAPFVEEKAKITPKVFDK